MNYFADPINTPPVIVMSDETIANMKKYEAACVAYSKLPNVPSTSTKVQVYSSSRSSPYKDNVDYTNRSIYNFTQPPGKPIMRYLYFDAKYSDPTSALYN